VATLSVIRRWALREQMSSYRLAEALDQEALAVGVMLQPGSGGSAAMLGSLAGHAAKRVKNPTKLSIALLWSKGCDWLNDREGTCSAWIGPPEHFECVLRHRRSDAPT